MMMWQWDNWGLCVCVCVCVCVCFCVCWGACACIQSDVRAHMIYHVLVRREEEDGALKSLGLQGQVKGHGRSEC